MACDRRACVTDPHSLSSSPALLLAGVIGVIIQRVNRIDELPIWADMGG